MSENLGRTKAVQIRDFPEAVWDLIGVEARKAGETVAEFLTRIILSLRDSGWLANPETAEPPQPVPAGVVPTMAELALAVETAIRLVDRKDDLPAGIRSLSNQLLRVKLLGWKVSTKQAYGMVGNKGPDPRMVALIDMASDRLAIAAP